jgi:hypothetical protein
MVGIAGRLYTRREKREERKDEERSLQCGRDDRVRDHEAQREERSLHCASAKSADAPVGMTD